ncbi:galactose oxidase [Chitinophaga sedimenti]|uniref:galactose oxidase n=1 Tax=Chitinophaga sedimenti TaxID=2033606 RepID=UPI002004C0AC|nr:galactose oxidase [Chitinophaga sedimenti]MCK7555501.1 galactose oxidase [Chitinophaga sedimenti]
MKRLLYILLMSGMIQSCVPGARTRFEWNTLPAIPDSTGFAGSFAGVAGNALLVAGGANFPNGGTPWNGGKKTWYDKVFVLDRPDGQWKEAGQLPRPLGYGVSVSTAAGLICIGGSNADGHYSDVFRLKWAEGVLSVDTLPSLPATLANTCGAMVDSCIYVAGGLHRADDQESSHDFYKLDLRKPDAWEQLPAWPGPSRMLSVAGALGRDFYLFSGAQLQEGKRSYLKDAYRYNPTTGWHAIAPLPAATVAAPSPAWSNGETLHVFGGDDGEDADSAAVLKEKHPGFSAAVLAFDTATGAWSKAATIFTRKEIDAVKHPNNSIWSPVTTAFALWNGVLVFPGGEVRPGTRTPNVLTATYQH